MKRVSNVFDILVLCALPLSFLLAYYVYFLPPILSRFIYLGAPLFLMMLGFLTRRSTRYILLLLLSTFIFVYFSIAENRFYLEPTINGFGTYEAAERSKEYSDEGHLVIQDPKSYFPLTAILAYDLNIIMRIPQSVSALLLSGLYIFLVTITCVLILQRNENVSFLTLPASLALITNPLMGTLVGTIGYNFFDTPFLFLSLYFLINREKSSRKTSLIILILIIGSSISGTRATIIAIMLFAILAVYSFQWSIVVYSIIPLAYLLYSAWNYVMKLSYLMDIIQALKTFFFEAFSWSEMRILPTQRTQLTTYADVLISIIGSLSLIILSFLLMIYLLLHFKLKVKERSLSYALITTLLYIQTLFAIFYIGGSVLPEQTVSDVRILLLPLSYWVLPFISLLEGEKIKRNKILSIILVVLLSFSSFFTIGHIYPKSFQDPINVVEDLRLNREQTLYFAHFAKVYLKDSFYADYATLRIISPFFFYSKTPTIPTLLPAKKNGILGLVVFNIDGLKYGSLYYTKSYYESLYDSSIKETSLLYNSGKVFVILYY